MKTVRLTLVATIALFAAAACIDVYGDNTPIDTGVEANHHALSCRSGGCNDASCNHGFRGRCEVGKCTDGSCAHCSRFCPRHGKACKHGCLDNQYSYGRMEVCPGKTNGLCPVHGYGACPHQREPIGPALRQALTPADRPYFGDRPIYVPREQYDPNFQARFPRVRALFLTPPAPKYMTTAPAAPMPTYTTRSPRDFLNPNPPSIGY